MLTGLDDNGNFTWECQRAHNHADPANTTILKAHVSHPDVQYVQPDLVALPPCPHCQASGHFVQTTIKIRFTDEERANIAPQYAPVTIRQNMAHADTGAAVPVQVTVQKPSGPHPSFAFHEAFPQHMARVGKQPPS
jgi:hypothetical protein